MRKRTQTAITRSGVLLTLSALVGATAGCGGTVIDSAKAEATLEQSVEQQTGRKVASVDCPSGIEVTPKTTFECTVSYTGGEREVAVLEIRNSDADLSLTSLEPERTAEHK